MGRVCVVALALEAAIIGLPRTACGLDTQGTSSAYGLSVDSHLVDLSTLLGIGVDAALGPTPTVSGTAPAPYNLNNSLASAAVDASSALLGGGSIHVNAATSNTVDVLSVAASSTVDGAAGSRNAQASSAVANFNSNVNSLGRVSLLNSAGLFNFSAMTLSSSASVSGDSGALAATGDSAIIDANGAGDGFATFTVLGLNFNVAVDAQGHVAPNTTLTINASSAAGLGDHLGTDLAGSIRLILNEQTLTGDGISSRGIAVNALHITFQNAGAQFFSALGVNVDNSNLGTGDIIIAHSQASMLAVPEPGAFRLLAASSVMLALRLFRRKNVC